MERENRGCVRVRFLSIEPIVTQLQWAKTVKAVHLKCRKYLAKKSYNAVFHNGTQTQYLCTNFCCRNSVFENRSSLIRIGTRDRYMFSSRFSSSAIFTINSDLSTPMFAGTHTSKKSHLCHSLSNFRKTSSNIFFPTTRYACPEKCMNGGEIRTRTTRNRTRGLTSKTRTS